MQKGTDKPKSQEEVEKEFPEFVNQLKWTLITDKILREQHIEVTGDDIKTFAKQQLFGYMPMKGNEESQPWLQDYVNRMMEDKKFVEEAYHRLQTRKVFEWAESNATALEKSISSEEFGKLLHEHQHHKH
jgi:trigger factor